MNAFSRISRTITGSDAPLLEQIETPWGFRLRPADMEEKASDFMIEWGLNLLGLALLISAFAQWLLPSSLYVGNGLIAKFVLTCVLGMLGGLCMAVSARGFRPEVQVDRVRQEIRFVSRNPRGRGQILATVDIDQIIGVGITRSLATGDCHCLIYLIDGQKPLRIATGTEEEIRRIRKKMDNYVTPPEQRLAAKMAARKKETPSKPASAA
ncbi:MAG: hypothetical protein AAF230_05530 [Pseudomonadota bacterium]